MHTYTKL